MNKLFTVMGGKFKFQVQDSDLEYLSWQCEKHIALSEKKPPLVLYFVLLQLDFTVKMFYKSSLKMS